MKGGGLAASGQGDVVLDQAHLGAPGQALIKLAHPGREILLDDQGAAGHRPSRQQCRRLAAASDHQSAPAPFMKPLQQILFGETERVGGGDIRHDA